MILSSSTLFSCFITALNLKRTYLLKKKIHLLMLAHHVPRVRSLIRDDRTIPLSVQKGDNVPVIVYHIGGVG